MKRTEFLKKSALGIVGGIAASKLVASGLESSDFEKSTFNAEVDRVGYNHLPNKPSKVMENMILHRANTRGNANHGWLNSNHTFSFANYHNPERMHFGVLRVLNDDHVEPGMGFGTHPHNNMEIISIPLEGDLEHKDSMGNVGVIKQGDVQVMSAGTGVQHSEYNKNKDKAVKFLQIWLFPKKKGVTPRYDQMSFPKADRHNKLQQVLSPFPDDEGVWIHQDAWFHMGDFDKGFSTTYDIKKSGNGVYAFVLKGSININGQDLNSRDGLGIWNTNSLKIESTTDAELLLMEVPMEIA
jgi:redox-sensitive bicupin YhaK (pirin superfamily)